MALKTLEVSGVLKLQKKPDHGKGLGARNLAD
jgi:hypothetical protein